MIARVKTLELHPQWTIHLFLPIAGNHEPDTYAIADWLRQQYPYIRLVLSKTVRGDNSMTHYVWEADTTLALNHWGIPEPDSGTAVPPTEIDAVFVPLLAFDKYGNRVGYGKGFYDRFLAECPTTTLKIGISLFDAVEEISDVSPYDIPLDKCITPARIWAFNTAP